MRPGLVPIIIALLVAAPARADVGLAPGQPFDQQAATALLEAPLARAAGAQGLRITVAQPSLPLHNPYPQAATLQVSGVRVTAGDRFVAAVEIHVGDRPPLSLTLSGSFQRLLGVPVPAATIAAGTLLGPAHFETLWLAQNRIRGDWLARVAEVEGREAYRALVAGQPVAGDAIGPPRLVRRGEPVTVVFAEGGLRLETTATARSGGGRGDVVEVENSVSGAVVTGRVIGPARIAVEVP